MKNDSGKSKYAILTEDIRSRILSGEIAPGEKIPSEYQLVETYGVSRHTVRKALSILENEGFVEAHHGKGTFCTNRRQGNSKSHNVAVVTTYISDYIFPRVIQGMERVLSEHGYSLILKNTNNSRVNESRTLEELIHKNIDGLIIEPSKSQLYCGHTNLFHLMEEYQIPYVFIQGIYEQMRDHDCVLMDDCLGGYLATKHMIELGHRHIVGIFKADDMQGQERHKGYVKALQEAGFSYNPEMVIWFHTEDRKLQPARMLRNLLNRKTEVDGVVCYNDQIAVSVVEMLQKMDLQVPEDISVIGYDDSYLAQTCPVKLTSVAHPHEELGAMAATILLEKLEGISLQSEPVQELIQPKLIIRDSCRKRDA